MKKKSPTFRILYTILILTLFALQIKAQKVIESNAITCNPNSNLEIKDCSTLLFDKKIPDHPRLLFTSERETEIKKLINKDPFMDNLLNFLKQEANKLLITPSISYPIGVPSILAISREHIYRIITLSLAYRMFNDSRYAAKAQENLINVCKYPNWGPHHYLDVAEMTIAVAIGYDWLYRYLSEDSKVLIAKTLRERALLPAIQEYDSGGTTWAKRETNWNVVCNTGMIMGALAIAENEPDMAKKIIAEGVKCIPNCLKYFAPDGVCYEGPGYWYYTTINLAMLINCLNDNIGTDFGISNLPGISQTATYYVSSISPSGRIFNFADTSKELPHYGPTYFFFSRKFKLPQVAQFYRELIKEVIKSPDNNPRWHFFLNIPWYDPSSPPTPIEIPRLQLFNNQFNPILVLTGKKDCCNPIYLIAKGGEGNMPHQHLDTGSFIVESDGIRWLDDLGTVATDYSLNGFWDYTPYIGKRWKYFRYNNFSHNTLSINNKLQNSAGCGKIIRYNKNVKKPFGIIDMTTVYDKLATKVQRGFQLLSDSVVLIQDEITITTKAKNIQWRAITNANITIKKNTAILQKNGKLFYIKIVKPLNTRFTKEQASVYSSKEAPVEGYFLLKTTLSSINDPNQTIQIVMSCDKKILNSTEWNKIMYPLTKWEELK